MLQKVGFKYFNYKIYLIQFTQEAYPINVSPIFYFSYAIHYDRSDLKKTNAQTENDSQTFLYLFETNYNLVPSNIFSRHLKCHHNTNIFFCLPTVMKKKSIRYLWPVTV